MVTTCPLAGTISPRGIRPGSARRVPSPIDATSVVAGDSDRLDDHGRLTPRVPRVTLEQPTLSPTLSPSVIRARAVERCFRLSGGLDLTGLEADLCPTGAMRATCPNWLPGSSRRTLKEALTMPRSHDWRTPQPSGQPAAHAAAGLHRRAVSASYRVSLQSSFQMSGQQSHTVPNCMCDPCG